VLPKTPESRKVATMLERFDRPLFLVGCGNMAGSML